MMGKIKLAVIGGSGIYTMPGLSNPVEYQIETPFGKPSSPIVIGEIKEHKIAFLARHGRGHAITPGDINYRANILALKSIGVERILSISACGSLREDFAPGDFVIPDQLFDNTHLRAGSFFGEGLVAHISVAEPFCEDLSNLLESSIKSTNAKVHRGGSMVIIEGPRFSTKSESNTYRSWGMSIIGMTTSPEAFLAREAEMCYSVMAHVTDYDVWHTNESPVTVDKVLLTLGKNTNTAREAIIHLVSKIDSPRNCDCSSALSSALITAPSHISSEKKEQLKLLVNKYIL
jgi:5'-methylthioadenosine phosphorylase